MTYIIVFLSGVAAGAIAGILAYRNNQARARNLEARGKSVLDALKGR
jgi:hypothetical protein